MDKNKLINKLKQNINVLIILIIALIGIILIIVDNYKFKTDKAIFISIGCSLLASSLVAFLTSLFLKNGSNKEIDLWSIQKIFERRSDKNKESDPYLKDLSENLDGIAFGLKKWRTNNRVEIQNALNRGVNMRLITMNPNSSHVQERATEEGQNENLQNSINDLISFCNDLNTHSTNGKIKVKGYNCMTLDFYWRMDDFIYVGPYLFKKDSSDTITYKFTKGGKGYDYYKSYFEELWNNDELVTLVQ